MIHSIIDGNKHSLKKKKTSRGTTGCVESTRLPTVAVRCMEDVDLGNSIEEGSVSADDCDSSIDRGAKGQSDARRRDSKSSRPSSMSWPLSCHLWAALRVGLRYSLSSVFLFGPHAWSPSCGLSEPPVRLTAANIVGNSSAPVPSVCHRSSRACRLPLNREISGRGPLDRGISTSCRGRPRRLDVLQVMSS